MSEVTQNRRANLVLDFKTCRVGGKKPETTEQSDLPQVLE